MNKYKNIPVLLITGFLGSGKTTLLNHILHNSEGIRFAVIVNDIGEVNIDAEMIARGGIVKEESGDLVALQNGCICCSLQSDLIRQIENLIKANSFDYIVIEASGICEPAPIAQTIMAMQQADIPEEYDMPRPELDAIVSVVDALRLKDEFASASALSNPDIKEDDLENLIIEQIEFCNIILLNKVDEISAEDKKEIYAVIRALQPKAKIIECNYCDVPLSEILNTHLFDFEDVATSASWVREIEKPLEELDMHDHHQEEHDHHHEEHDHHHHHHHGHNHEGHSHTEEYGISTFVYYRRRPFEFHKFERFISMDWPKEIIRAKGVLYFNHNRDMSILFEQAGKSKELRESGLWFATAPEEELELLIAQEPGLKRDWDDNYGDRMIKLVFIGKNLDWKLLETKLDDCLAEY